jgi:hypothetical protein
MLKYTLQQNKLLDYLKNIEQRVIVDKKNESGLPEKNTSFAPTYGELLIEDFLQIISHMEINDNDIFYDFGSGSGKVCLYFSFLTPIEKAIGIEFVKSRHNSASNLLSEVTKSHPNLGNKINLINNDMNKENTDDATIIFTCSTCFSEDLLKNISDKVKKANQIRYVISTTKEIPDISYKDKKTLSLKCSWGTCTIHLYKMF